ncbi:MAG: chloride channel protein [Prolixibacteraceae bacterium]|jgi:CIC family chloride channel protein|nr:chloride channel protein [Prolixibacteraceae bacterium]
MRSEINLLEKFHRWRNKNLSTKTFIIILSIIIGIASGFGAVILKNAVKLIHNIPSNVFSGNINHYLYFVYPVFGITLAVLFIRFILKKPVRHGIPNVLYGISRRKGYLGKHNLFSSIITSALTVGFGGSVGLEGPTVATGAAIGSQLSRFFRLEYKYVVLMLACACSGAMAAIFKAPIAAIVFAVEVIMIDLTTFSLIPLLLASASAVLTSYLFLGMDVLYPFEVQSTFILNDIPFYVVLGILAGIVSVYFIKMYMAIEKIFSKMKKATVRLLVGGLTIGTLIFVFPSLYGEGYEAINSGLAGDVSYLFENPLFEPFNDNLYLILGLLFLVIIFKVIATSATFGAGGVGGIFAPTLFTGVNTGLFFALFTKNILGFNLNVSNFALIGMAGLIAGVLHAPLTGIFLIADISGGYKLFVPLMITATFSYITVKAFTKNSVYTFQLALRKQLVTHHKDKHVLSIMNVPDLIEKDFVILNSNDTIRNLVDAISVSHRNLFPITDHEGIMVGMLKMDDVRHLIFKQETYDKIKLKEIMYMPEHWISPHDSMEEVVKKFEDSGRYNLAVIDNGKYVGFISRAKVFSNYRKFVKDFSHD